MRYTKMVASGSPRIGRLPFPFCVCKARHDSKPFAADMLAIDALIARSRPRQSWWPSARWTASSSGMPRRAIRPQASRNIARIPARRRRRGRPSVPRTHPAAP